jgi:hypothetical protein
VNPWVHFARGKIISHQVQGELALGVEGKYDPKRNVFYVRGQRMSFTYLD